MSMPTTDDMLAHLQFGKKLVIARIRMLNGWTLSIAEGLAGCFSVAAWPTSQDNLSDHRWHHWQGDPTRLDVRIWTVGELVPLLVEVAALPPEGSVLVPGLRVAADAALGSAGEWRDGKPLPNLLPGDLLPDSGSIDECAALTAFAEALNRYADEQEKANG